MGQHIRSRVKDALQLRPDEYLLELRCYGRDAVPGHGNPTVPQEVGVVLRVRAADQATATRSQKRPTRSCCTYPPQG